MNEQRVRVYVALMCLAGIACVATTPWKSLLLMQGDSLAGLAGLIGIAVLSESLAIGVSVGPQGRQTASVTFLPILASIQLFGGTGAVALAMVTVPFAELLVRRKGVFRASFNVAQTVVATTVAAAVFTRFRGVALEGPLNVDENIATQLGPFIAAGLTLIAINHAAVSLAITLSQGLPFRKVWQRALDNTGASLSDLLISPIALAVAFLYVQFRIAGIVIILLPMLFIRHSYLTTSRLRESNSDLLTALVKAIEIRDPYTSGHSVRVSNLARRIAESLGLNRFLVERVTTAALVHDIGKIEAIYTEILRKPDALTSDERTIIESHVTRGEELLRNLSSVPEEVVRFVRHHHEREDGNGYPDGLLGDDIPIGSKIIAVCDAVDAMLSDRPYRDALPVPAVLDQLREHAGHQFDHRVVESLLQTDALAEFAETMRSVREQSRAAERRSSEMPVHIQPVPGFERIPPGARSRQYH